MALLQRDYTAKCDYAVMVSRKNSSRVTGSQAGQMEWQMGLDNLVKKKKSFTWKKDDKKINKSLKMQHSIHLKVYIHL